MATTGEHATIMQINEHMGGTVGQTARRGPEVTPAGISLRTLLVIASCVVAAMLLVCCARASASVVELEIHTSSFDGSDGVGVSEPTFPIFGVEKLDVNRVSEDVIVGAGERIYGFDKEGTSTPFSALTPNTLFERSGLSSFSDVEVDNSGTPTQGNIYVANGSREVFGYAPSGAPLAGFPISGLTEACGLAVDSHGNLWVGDYSQGLKEYHPNGDPTGVVIHPNSNEMCDFDMDSQDNFYVPEFYSGGQTVKYNSAGVFQYVVDSGSARQVAVDLSNDDVYVDLGEKVNHYSSTGTFINSFGESEGSYPGLFFSRGIAVNPQTHKVYVGSNYFEDSRVDVFTPTGPITVADITTENADAITRTAAMLHATVNADGVATSDCHFDFGTSQSYGEEAPCFEGNVFNDTSDHPVTAPLSGLSPGTTYHYRVSVTNPNHTSLGADLTFSTPPAVTGTTTEAATAVSRTGATLNGSFDPDGFDTHYYFEYGTDSSYGITTSVPPGIDAGEAPGVQLVSAPTGTLVQGTTYHFRIVTEDIFGVTYGEDETFETQPAVKEIATNPATSIKAKSAVVNGQFDPDGVDTHYYFEYGKSKAYGLTTAVPPGVDGGEASGLKTVSATLTELNTGSTYHFRLVAENSFGKSFGKDREFKANEAPSAVAFLSQANTDSAVLKAVINPNSLATTYHFEYGPGDCSVTTCTAKPSVSVGKGILPVTFTLELTGLTPGSINHFRVVAENSRGKTITPDSSFRTFTADSGTDECANAHVRQQTGAALLMDCRAYELVSAGDTGGYDVESDLVPGQTPLVSPPTAEDRLLYALHFGSVPNIAGSPTAFGGDPYVARRGDTGWVTGYVGLPSDGMKDKRPFGSPLLGTDAGLRVFAFGGQSICSPCFEDGSTNVPLRLADGSLVEGMAGSLNPSANPTQQVAKPVSTNGSHFVFGSNAKFDESGDSGGSIYDRDLKNSTTQVVSTMPNGLTMTGGNLGELDISSDGTRIVVAKKVSTDAKGNDLWHPYMHVGTSSNTVDLAPGTTSGVIFAGMTSTGSAVYFTTRDKLLAADTDESADLYVAEVAGTGPAVLKLISAGAPAPIGNSDACNPTANTDGNNWNTVGVASVNNCGVVAIAAGGGMASGDGTIYFLSPEKLDGSGTLNEPNLFVARPGSTPHFVATLEPDNPTIRDAVADSELRQLKDFQVTPSGNFAAFDSRGSLTGFPNLGHTEIYRYDAASPTLDCVSCSPSGASPLTDTSLGSFGLNLSDGGATFFTSTEQLVLRDSNGKKDAYEWKEGHVQLVSTGIGDTDSGFLSISPDGVNAYFFTRQTLAPEDQNGSAMKIYDARAQGGFPYNPPPKPCAASDECHGPGTQAAGSPSIRSATGSGHEEVAVTRGKKNRHKKHHHKKRHHKTVARTHNHD